MKYSSVFFDLHDFDYQEGMLHVSILKDPMNVSVTCLIECTIMRKRNVNDHVGPIRAR